MGVPRRGEEDPDPVPPSRRFLLGLVFTLLLLAGILVRAYLGAVVLAALLGFLLHPLYARLVHRARYRWLAAGLVLLLVAVSIALPLALIGWRLVAEAAGVAQLAREPRAVEGVLASWAARLGLPEEAVGGLVQRGIEQGGALVSAALAKLASHVPHLAASVLVFFILLYFALRDGEAIVATVRRLTPLREETKDHLFTLVAKRTRAIALGTFLVSIVQGVVSGIGWWLFGFPAPFFWGFVMTVIAVLPFGAPFLVLVPAGILALLQGDWFSGVGILLFAALVVGVIDDVLRPLVVGRGSGVHPGLVLLGTLGGLAVFGASGFLLGPLLLGLLGPVMEVWAKERRDEQP